MNYSLRDIASVITAMALSAWALNAALVAALAFPFMWLWNEALAPLGLPGIGYWRALWLLLLWWVLKLSGKGLKVSLRLR